MKKLYSALILLLSFTSVKAQELNLGDVEKYYSRGTGAIMGLGEVKGYYFFYMNAKDKVSKADKYKRRFKLIITDANLVTLSDKNIIDDINVFLSDACFNGEYLAFKFVNYDRKDSYYKIRIMDKNGDMVSSKKIKIENRSKMVQSTDSEYEDEIGESQLYPVPQKGFVHILNTIPLTSKPGKELRTMEFISHNKNDSTSKGWKYSPKLEKGNIEFIDFLNASSEVIYLNVNHAERFYDKETTESLRAISTTTGKVLFDKVYDDDKFHYEVMNLNYSTVKKEHLVFGNLYNKGEKSLKAKSKGIYIMRINDSGEPIESKQIMWDNIKADFKFEDEDGKEGEMGNIFIHKIIPTKEGKIFAIGERFKRALDGGQVAVKALSVLAYASGVSSSGVDNLVLQHMVLMEFDNNLVPKDVRFIDKGKNRISLPQGWGLMNLNKLANIAKMYGWFDYAFTQEKKDKSGFVVGYNSEKGENGLGTFAYQNGNITEDKIILSKKANVKRIFPGKYGYVMVFEYFKKEKKISTRLEKINM